MAQGRYKDAVAYLKKWRDWYAYDIVQHVLDWLVQSKGTFGSGAPDPQKFAEAMNDEVAPLVGVISFFLSEKSTLKALLAKLARLGHKGREVKPSSGMRADDEPIFDGIFVAAACAISMGLKCS